MNTSTVLVMLAHLATAPASDSLSAAEVQAAYPDFFPIEVVTLPGSTQRGIARGDARLHPDHPLAGVFDKNRHGGIVSFLVQHGTGFVPLDVLRPEADSLGVVRSYYDRLREDSVFNAGLLPVVARYLTAKGGTLIGYATDEPRRVVPLQLVVDAATRFFYPHILLPDGRVGVHICVGVNGFQDVPRERRDVHVEALAFATIRREMEQERVEGNHSPLLAMMHEQFAEVKKGADLPAEPQARLAALQQRIWVRLAESEMLRQAILAEYERQREVLPFVIDDADEHPRGD